MEWNVWAHREITAIYYTEYIHIFQNLSSRNDERISAFSTAKWITVPPGRMKNDDATSFFPSSRYIIQAVHL